MKATQLHLLQAHPVPDRASDGVSGGSDDRLPVRDLGSTNVEINLTADEPAVDLTEVNAHYLSARDRRILALERQWFANAGSKEAAITRQFGITPTRYFQILNGLIDDPLAMREAPQVVARLRRLRTARQTSRRQYRRVLRHRG
jgi:hypothetical protein